MPYRSCATAARLRLNSETVVTKSEILDQFRHLATPPDPRFTDLVERCDEPELCNRRNFTGHLTASGVIVRLPQREVLLLRHRALGKWLAPGGHVEAGDASPAAAALREIAEETGIAADELIPVNVVDGVQYCAEVSSHHIPRNEARGEEEHMHHDFRFLFVYTGHGPVMTDARESAGYRWVSLDDDYIHSEILCIGNVDALLATAVAVR